MQTRPPGLWQRVLDDTELSGPAVVVSQIFVYNLVSILQAMTIDDEDDYVMSATMFDSLGDGIVLFYLQVV